MSEVVEVLNSFVTASQGLQASTTMADAYNKSFFWDERMEWYEHGRSPTEEGIRCGFSHIDTATHGIVPGQLWTLFAPPKSYKTSALCYMAAHFQKQDKRVLFVSFEMTHQEVLERIDAIHAGVSLSKIRDGALDKAEVEAIRDATSILSSMYVQSGHQHDTVGGVQGLIGDVDPDIVIIDGAYFIRDPESNERGTPRALTNVTRDLKRVASVAGKPILISTQALSWKMNKKAKLAHESIGYSSSFSQDSDLVVGMRRVEDASGMPGKADLVEMDIVLSRNGPLMQASLEWKWSEGRWSYVGVEDDDDEDEDDDS
jgi:replicative DNA helicase